MPMTVTVNEDGQKPSTTDTVMPFDFFHISLAKDHSVSDAHSRMKNLQAR